MSDTQDVVASMNRPGYEYRTVLYGTCTAILVPTDTDRWYFLVVRKAEGNDPDLGGDDVSR